MVDDGITLTITLLKFPFPGLIITFEAMLVRLVFYILPLFHAMVTQNNFYANFTVLQLFFDNLI